MPAKKTEKPALATAPDLPERYRMALWEAGLVLADVHAPGGSVLLVVEAEEILPSQEDEDGSEEPSSTIN